MQQRGSFGADRRGGIFGWAIAGLVVALLAVALVAWTVVVLFGHTGPWPYFAGGFFFFPFGLLLLLLLAFLAFRFAFWGARWGGGWRYGAYGHGGPWGPRYGMGYGPRGAEEILRRRYASGELTREQFESMMRDLRAQG